MDAKPMTPAEMSALLRKWAPYVVEGSILRAADCIDAQAAEITALRAAVRYMTDEALKLRAERDALAARLAVPGEEAASMATRCTPEYAAGFWAGVKYGRHRAAGQHADVVQSDALSPAPQEVPDAE